MPYKGHIHNPGMGIITMAVSDHMTTGYTPQERAVGDRKKPFSLTEKMLDEVTALPYIDNIYIRVGWNDVQKEKGRLELIPEFEMAVEAAQKAGISDIHPHMFRHTFVSLLMSNPDIGVATVAAEAGHAQPSTTLMIYTQQYKKRRESIRNQLSRELYEK